MRNQLIAVLTSAALGMGGLVAAVPASAATVESTSTTPSAVRPTTALTRANLEYSRSGNQWTFKVTYTCAFNTAELSHNYEWQATIKLWDDDPVSSDHIATKVQTIRPGPGQTTVKKTVTFTLPRTAVDKDNPDQNEEIFAGIRLKNISTEGKEFKITTRNYSIRA
ncbi:hypothetical protein G9272_01320 [Streptomyces asoensis]|uniref:Uncharacterized protein n=1 Tax=Streptomyces asoensis TaxID=249586 RepID=A0A6M4WEY3_9ACTN|nr:hypothetical protein [Streptomyces asoensis]QJS99129.1 hypothetical protein G9272_01320 [Streptomyces asoensis]